MGGGRGPEGSQQQMFRLQNPSLLDRVVAASAAPGQPETPATKASGAELDRRRDQIEARQARSPSASGRLTAPRNLQKRTLLGE